MRELLESFNESAIKVCRGQQLDMNFEQRKDVMLKEYVESLNEKGIRLTFDENAQKCLAKKAYGGKSGARDLRNLIRKEVEDRIASAIVESRTGTLSAIHLTAEQNEIKMDIFG